MLYVFFVTNDKIITSAKRNPKIQRNFRENVTSRSHQCLRSSREGIRAGFGDFDVTFSLKLRRISGLRSADVIILSLGTKKTYNLRSPSQAFHWCTLRSRCLLSGINATPKFIKAAAPSSNHLSKQLHQVSYKAILTRILTTQLHV